jgi:hypothetical protein
MRDKMPAWAVALLDQGRIPAQGTPDYEAFQGWRFFGDSIPGLPPEGSREASEILARAK